MVEVRSPLPTDSAPPMCVMAPVVVVPLVVVEDVQPAPVVEFVAPVPGVTYAAPAPEVELIVPAPVVTYAAPAPCHRACGAGSCGRTRGTQPTTAEPQLGDLGFDKDEKPCEVMHIGCGWQHIDKIRVLYPWERPLPVGVGPLDPTQ